MFFSKSGWNVHEGDIPSFQITFPDKGPSLETSKFFESVFFQL
jgi:hypothetical protein